MVERTREQRLFGAACLKLQLERTSRAGAEEMEIYRGALADLMLTEEEVEAYLGLDSNAARVRDALRAGEHARR